MAGRLGVVEGGGVDLPWALSVFLISISPNPLGCVSSHICTRQTELSIDNFQFSER